MINREVVMKKTLLLGVLVAGLVAGCSWVDETAAGKQVNVVGAANVTNCEKLGSVSVEVKADLVLDIQRSPEKVADELATLARNRAAENGADSVVAISPVENGKQKFAMYRCAK